jgi:hypothetical protein
MDRDSLPDVDAADFAVHGSEAATLLPLTGAQRDVWFHQQLSPASTQYNLGQFCRIQGAIERQRLADAFDRVVACLDALRARIVVQNGMPLQQLVPPRSAGMRSGECPTVPMPRRSSNPSWTPNSTTASTSRRVRCSTAA